MYGFFVKVILLDSAGFFRCFKVNFNLQKTSAEVNSVYFLPLISLMLFLGFKHFYSISTISSTPSFVHRQSKEWTGNAGKNAHVADATSVMRPNTLYFGTLYLSTLNSTTNFKQGRQCLCNY